MLEEQYIHLYVTVSSNTTVFQPKTPVPVMEVPSSLPPTLFESIITLGKRLETSRGPYIFVDSAVNPSSAYARNTLTLEDCLASYFHQEVMGFSADYTCEKCGRVVEVLRDIQMDHPPEVLILHLMRFAFDVYTPIKLYEDVNYPRIVCT